MALSMTCRKDLLKTQRRVKAVDFECGEALFVAWRDRAVSDTRVIGLPKARLFASVSVKELGEGACLALEHGDCGPWLIF